MSFRQTLPLLTQKSKSKSSKQWVSRQLRDPYVKKRLTDSVSYRSRSAFKLLEINDQMGGFLDHRDVKTVVDLGAAPGGWSQVVVGKFGTLVDERVDRVRRKIEVGSIDVMPREFGEKDSFCLSDGKPERNSDLQCKKPVEYPDPDDNLLGSMRRGRRTIVAVDLLPIEPIPGVHIVRGDFLHDSTMTHIRTLLPSKGDDKGGKADVILSDMAANVSGNTVHDTESSLEICEVVFEFAKMNLRSADVIGRRNGGVLLVKFFAHPLLDQFRKEKLERNFYHVRYVKPESSRTASREGYFFCSGWAPR